MRAKPGILDEFFRAFDKPYDAQHPAGHVCEGATCKSTAIRIYQGGSGPGHAFQRTIHAEMHNHPGAAGTPREKIFLFLAVYSKRQFLTAETSACGSVFRRMRHSIT